MTTLNGYIAPGYESVGDAFLENFSQRGELGAAVTIYKDGDLVVDIFGGLKRREDSEPWDGDTIVCVASVSKALTATAMLQLIEKKLVDLSKPVADYWSEFGKPEITIEHILTHQAGLPGISNPLPPTAYMDWDLMIHRLEQEQPAWDPGTRHGYHPITSGFLVGEVLRRVTGQSVGEYLDAHICGPNELDFFLGLRQDKTWNIADMQPLDFTDRNASPEFKFLIEQSEDPNSFWSLATTNPKVPADIANWPDYRAAEVPAGNGHASARAISGFYQHLGSGALLSSETLSAATTERVYGVDAVLGVPSRFGLGFMLRHDYFPIGPAPTAYGHPGAGGNLGFYDPENRIAFGYVMNQGKPSIFGSPTAYALVEAFYKALNQEQS